MKLFPSCSKVRPNLGSDQSLRTALLTSEWLIRGKPFDATFRITDVYRESHGKWVIVQEHISVPPDAARW